jgi:hypothetical protein
MRSKPEFNYPAFNDAARCLRAAGWRVFNPAEMDVQNDGILNLSMTIQDQRRHSGDYENARRYAGRDINILIKELRAERGDAIVLLPGWEDSVGAIAEKCVAEWLGLEILRLEEIQSNGIRERERI